MYDHGQIEKKWQKKWVETGLYKTGDDPKKPKYYILDMFPYPSGTGLHVGHPKGYIATDILARMRLMQGYNVLHPMGFDAFGLPTENYALKNKIQPQKATDDNIAVFKKQLEILGFSYDWEREVITTDPKYYKWTQWIFLQMWQAGLAYESSEPINWCPSCQTGLANEDLEDGKCERCGSEVEQKPMRQWVLRITKYAERLLNDLEKLTGWEESIKEMQRNWIGRSEGAEIDFKIRVEGGGEAENSEAENSEAENEEGKSSEEESSGGKNKSIKKPEIIKNNDKIIKVFTTRVDTIFGCTYVVLAPENNLVTELKAQIKNWPAVEKYLAEVKNKTDLQRTDLNKEKTGVVLEGVKAINPFNNEEVAVFVADYVLNSYGTGAVMAVPAHDERDYEFAKKYELEIKQVIVPGDGLKMLKDDEAFTVDGVLYNSEEFSDLTSAEARQKMTAWLEQKKLGAKKVNYKIKDWVFSRQRYWGEPIPLIHCEKCGVVAVPEKDLPVRLPIVDSYEPTGTGESPLAAIIDWVNVKCPQCGGAGQRETNTMPQWAGSCWYYLRYIDPRNETAMVDKKKETYWSPVDFYVGGAEHATRHLIYARFWHKFLYDIKAVAYDEPFTKLQHVGLIMGEDGRKMSKRWGNVINPNDIVAEYGADAMRVYEMFMGPFAQAVSWSAKGLVGARKFLEKVASLLKGIASSTEETIEGDFDLNMLAKSEESLSGALLDASAKSDISLSDALAKSDMSAESSAAVKKIISLLHKTIKKVGADIENFDFNTAVSSLMILVNELTDYKNKNNVLPITLADFKNVLKILAPFAPHLAEELWEKTGEPGSIFKSIWPEYDQELMKDETVSLVVQINGKLRANLEVVADISEAEAIKLAGAHENVAKWLAGKEVVKNVFIPGKLLNIVVK